MIVSEYEQMEADPASAADIPKEDQDIVKKVNELLMRSKRHRKKYDREWQYNYEFVINGKQWPMDRPRWRFNEAINLTWGAIMTEIAIQTDARPKFEFNPQEFGDEAFIDILRDINDRNWDKYKWNGVVADGLLDAKLYHVGHAIVEWDPDLESGLGDVSFRILDPFYCFWDPLASDVNKGNKARWFIYAEPRPTAELKMKYPDWADKIKPDVSQFNERWGWGLQNPGKIYNTFDPYSPSRLPSSASQSNQNDRFGGEEMTMLIRCWMRDDTMDEVCMEVEDVDMTTMGIDQYEPDATPASVEAQAKKTMYVTKYRYPKGRYIESCNNLLLRDGAPGIEINGEWIEYETDDFPVARVVNYSYPREYCGENEVTHTKGPQKVINYVWSYILDMFRMQSNPVTVIGDTGDVDEESITNEPGNIIRAADINQVRREPGTPITAGSFDLLTTASNLFDKVQGLQDVTRGAEAPNVSSGIMLEGYVEAAQTRPRMKNRNLDQFLQDAGELMVKRIMQFYTQPRIFRITNKQGYPQFIEFYVPNEEFVDDDGQIKIRKVAKIRMMNTTDQTFSDGTIQKVVAIKGMPDVRVTSGSALPFAKAQKAQTALTYFNAGAIDQEELLKATDWPNYEEVLRRMSKQAALAQQAKQKSGSEPNPQGAA